MILDTDGLHHPGTQALCQALEAEGFHALFVGGCVRNGLLGLPSDDIDISTDARPERVMQIAQSAGLKAVPTGIDHEMVLARTGRPAAPALTPGAVRIEVGQDAQRVIEDHPAGTSFVFAAGVHRLQSIIPRSGDRLTGETGGRGIFRHDTPFERFHHAPGHRGRTNGVDPDSVGSELRCSGSGQPNDRMLAGIVCTDPG